MRVRSVSLYAGLACVALALSACGGGDDRRSAESDAPAAEVEFAEETPPLAIPPAAPAPAAAEPTTPGEPVPYDALKADEKAAPPQKADAENENVFY